MTVITRPIVCPWEGSLHDDIPHNMGGGIINNIRGLYIGDYNGYIRHRDFSDSNDYAC